ncbi:MAG TPA: dUTP diphosphatase [Candidatus Syntrophosphaera sp.]|nr:dUTP diphosphatase [Candidatus Syntrophosphaera sp.]
MTVRFKLLSSSARPPQRMTEHSAGCDLSADLDADLILQPGERTAVPTGLALEIPPGFEGQVRPRSGLALNLGLGILNSPGTVDSDYRGEIKVILVNASTEPVTVKPAMRIAQLVVCPVAEVQFEESDTLGGSCRSDGGFGHTGS